MVKVTFKQDYLRKEFTIDTATAQEMTTDYLKNLDEIYDKTSTALISCDWSYLALLSHSIKGTSANVGAANTSRIGKELEQSCLKRDLPSCKTLVSELSSAI